MAIRRARPALSGHLKRELDLPQRCQANGATTSRPRRMEAREWRRRSHGALERPALALSAPFFRVPHPSRATVRKQFPAAGHNDTELGVDVRGAGALLRSVR